MNLHPSSSNLTPYDRLDPVIQRWVWDNDWKELREIQVEAINSIFDSQDDLVIAAATSAGKTEAAFMPILSQVAHSHDDGFAVLYIGPLKALINDQFRRLEELCERLKLPVVKWHGDASAAAKAKAIANPKGVVLITPESIESLLVRRGPDVRRLLSGTRYIIIDELHAFLANERGLHLASLLKRLEAQVGRHIRKVGLSATIGDFSEARSFLSPLDPDAARVIESVTGQAELRLQIRGYRDAVGEDTREPIPPSAHDQIVEHLFSALRGENNLVFGSRRAEIESYADGLLNYSKQAGVPNEFFPHHGSLAKGLRHELEERLKTGTLPTTAVATTTLELGVDIGSVKSVAQIGPPASIAGLRQRLGRSGRREGSPSILRIYISEPDKLENDDLFGRLRTDLFQAVAAVRLLVDKWVEPGGYRGTLLSTLLHQTLATIRERGGINAAELFGLLCGPGPFRSIDQTQYASLLRAMATTSPSLIEQASDGTIMLGGLGEQTTDRYDFYAVFMSDEEYRIVTDQRALGTLPIFNPLCQGDYLTFAGRRWIVSGVDDKAKTVHVNAAPAGKVPKFPSQEGPPLHDNLVAQMRTVYRSPDRPAYVDLDAWSLMLEGRECYQDLELDRNQILQDGDDAFIFAWRGTVALETLQLALATQDVRTRSEAVGLRALDCTASIVQGALRNLKNNLPNSFQLAEKVENLRRHKYDHLLPDELLRAAYAETRLDIESLSNLLDELV